MNQTKTADEAAALAAAESRALRAEMRLAISRAKLLELEAAAARAKEADAAGAVAELIRRGAIDRSDWLAQADFKVKFIADPELIRLALKPIKRRFAP